MKIEKKICREILLLGLSILGLLKMSITANAQSTAIPEYNYTVVEGECRYYVKELSNDACCITGIEVVGTRIPKTLTIPDSFSEKKVTKIGWKNTSETDYYGSVNIFLMQAPEYFPNEGFSPWGTEQQQKTVSGIEEIILPDSIKEIGEDCFASMVNLKSITLPSNLEKIEEDIFFICENLKEISIPAKVKEGVTYLFDAEQPQWETVTIAKSNSNYKIKNCCLISKNGKEFYCMVYAKNNVRIPNGVKTIKKEAFFNRTVKEIYIPMSVSKIEERALSCKNATNIKVAKKNKTFAKTKNCIYSKKGKKLVAVSMKSKTLVLPKKIKRLTGQGISVAGKSMNKLIINHPLKEIGVKWTVRRGMDSKIGNYYFLDIYMKSGKLPKFKLDIEESEYLNRDSVPVCWKLHTPKKIYSKYKKWLKKNVGFLKTNFKDAVNSSADICLLKSK